MGGWEANQLLSLRRAWASLRPYVATSKDDQVSGEAPQVERLDMSRASRFRQPRHTRDRRVGANVQEERALRSGSACPGVQSDLEGSRCDLIAGRGRVSDGCGSTCSSVQSTCNIPSVRFSTLSGALVLTLGCGTHLLAPPDTAKDYLAYVAFESPDHLGLLLHWSVRKMPLKVYLPPPPNGWFTNSDAVVEETHHAVTNWTDVASPGVPSFTFVDKAGDADIPIMWADVSPSWSVAHCFIRPDFPTRRFAVENVLITAWYRDGSQVPPEQLGYILMHEMGHALGFAGHSPNPEDIMYPGARYTKPGSMAESWELPPRGKELSKRDRETLRELYAKPNGTVLAGARRVY